MKKLTPAHEAELRHLRGQVDRRGGGLSHKPSARCTERSMAGETGTEKLCEWTETKRLPNLRERTDENNHNKTEANFL